MTAQIVHNRSRVPFRERDMWMVGLHANGDNIARLTEMRGVVAGQLWERIGEHHA